MVVQSFWPGLQKGFTFYIVANCIRNYYTEFDKFLNSNAFQNNKVNVLFNKFI